MHRFLRSGTHRPTAFIVVVAAAQLAGRTGYRAFPLDRESMDATLAAPDGTALASRTLKLCNPRVAAVKLDFSKPLTGDELGVIAVLARVFAQLLPISRP